MTPRLGVSFLALAAGLVVALLKLAGAFMGGVVFFGMDAILCAAVGIFTLFYAQASRRWLVLMGGQVFVMVAFFVGLVRAQGHDLSIGLWWLVSLLTTPPAALLGALLGGWIARRRDHAGSGGGPSGRPTDDVPLFGAYLAITGIVMLAAGVLASLAPAKRALRINPMEALRDT